MKGQMEKMEKQMAKWGAKLDDLVAKTEASGTEVKDDVRYSIDDLKAKYQVARTRLDEAGTAGAEQWKTFEDGVDGAWNELAAAFKKIGK